MECKAKLEGTSIPKIKHKAWNRYVQLLLGEQALEGCYHISYEDLGSQKQDLGILDLVTSKHIDLLSPIHGLSFNVVLSSDDFGTLKKRTKKTPDIFEVSVNIIGPARDAEQAADILLRNRCFLQHPVFLSHGIKYINPQYFYSGDTRDDLRYLIGPASRTEADAHSRRLQDGLEDAFGSLAKREQCVDDAQMPLAKELLRTSLKP